MNQIPPSYQSSPPSHSASIPPSGPRSSHQASYRTADNGGIRERDISRQRAISGGSQHLEQLLPEQIRSGSSVNLGPGHFFSPTYSSPQRPSQHQSQPALETVHRNSTSSWTTPAPPRSGSGGSSIASSDATSRSYSIGTSADRLARVSLSETTGTADMGSLGYMMPSHYQHPGGMENNPFGPAGYSFDQPYRSQMPMQPESHHYAYSQSSAAFSHAPVRTASPMSQMPQADENMQMQNPYAMRHGPSSASVPRAMSSPMQPPTLSSTHPNYQGSYERSASMYDTSMYTASLPNTHTLETQASPGMGYHQPMYSTPSQQPFQRSMSSASNTSVRVLSQKPKPQCWEHGCNGREFSTFSNLLRHQREKSGTASKSYCPKCGAEFTRTTARNGHLAHDKCSRPREPSDSR